MLKITETKNLVAELRLTPAPPALILAFNGNRDTFFLSPGLKFDFTDPRDAQEVDLLMELAEAKVYGESWASQLVGKEFRLIIETIPISRNSYRIDLYAIGQIKNDNPDNDLFLVLNSGMPLMSGKKAMKYIKKHLHKK